MRETERVQRATYGSSPGPGPESATDDASDSGGREAAGDASAGSTRLALRVGAFALGLGLLLLGVIGLTGQRLVLNLARQSLTQRAAHVAGQVRAQVLAQSGRLQPGRPSQGYGAGMDPDLDAALQTTVDELLDGDPELTVVQVRLLPGWQTSQAAGKQPLRQAQAQRDAQGWQVRASAQVGGVKISLQSAALPYLSLIRYVLWGLALGYLAFAVILLAMLQRWLLGPLSLLTARLEQDPWGKTTPPTTGGVAEMRRLSHALDHLQRTVSGQTARLSEQLQYLQDMQQQLISADRLATIGKLAAGFAHEVGNPLAAVSGLLELAETDPQSPDAPAYLRQSRTELERVFGLIRQWLLFARPSQDRGPRATTAGDATSTALMGGFESSALPLTQHVSPMETMPLAERQRLELRPLLERALALAAADRRFRAVTTRLTVKEPLPSVQVNEDAVLQILVNLLLNAAEACALATAPNRAVADDASSRAAGRAAAPPTPEKTNPLEAEPSAPLLNAPRAAIELSARARGDWVALEVRDRGPGLTAEVEAALFEPFVSTKADGIGLGLAVSKVLAEASGGALRGATHPEGGASFTLTLPIAPISPLEGSNAQS